MYINLLEVKNFRNYEEESVVFDQKINVIRGDNGQGKTNLLESIHLLSMGKSFRTGNDVEMIGFEKDFFHVKGIFIKDNRHLSVEMKLSHREKSFAVDGLEKKKNAELLENVYSVVFSPEDLKIVKEDPEKRRKFMDRELFQLKPLYYRELSHYRKALKNRNNLLKEEIINWDLMDVYDEYLSDRGARIMGRRSEFIEKLNRISREIHGNITGGKELLEITYESNVSLRPSLEEQKEVLLHRYRDTRKDDKIRRSTSAGPHKDDIKMTANTVDLRKYGSQGQQRTAALALKLAELRIIREETGVNPLLLMDDVLSELDVERQQFLIHSFEKNQLVITAADMSEKTMESLPKGKVFHIRGGNIFDS